MASPIADSLPVELNRFTDVVERIGKLLTQLKIYPSGHPSVEKYLEDAYDSLNEMLLNKSSIVLRMVKKSLFYLNYTFNVDDENRRNHNHLIKALGLMSVGEIEIEKGFAKAELLSFMEITASVLKGDRKFDLAGAWSRIDHIKVRHVPHFKDRDYTQADKIENNSPFNDLVLACKTKKKDSSVCGVIDDVLKKLEKIQSSEGIKAGRLILEMVGNEDSNNSMVLMLKSLITYDSYTFRHSVNVAVISAATARYIGFTEDEAGKIGLAALMHDIGKLYIPKKILLKSSRLSPSEWQVIKKHPVDGAKILKEEGIDEMTCAVAYQHHMRHDLTGYPRYRGEKILKASEIVRIADTYDALTTKRVYRKQISPYEAIKVMWWTRKTEFHPEYFDDFLHMMGNIPIGSILELDSGEKVIVVDISRDRGALPRVRVIKDKDGLNVEKDIILDLNEIDPATKKLCYRVKGVIDDPVRNIEIGKYLFARK
ncbi:MAG: HD domain-containing protein [Candidatus Krumholzibacteriota bacterium]|nr:HD domain-containing protein [Candidatus Krumholzibacteriota bacterium]